MTALGRRMEIADNNKLPFLGMMIEKRGCHRTTSVYRKPTDTGLLLHYHSHVDHRYKKPLLNTMLNRAYHPSSTRESFTNECEHLKRMFTKLKYPANFVNSAITTYKNSATQGRHEIPTVVDTDIQKTVRITLPFKEQKTVCIINVWGNTEISVAKHGFEKVKTSLTSARVIVQSSMALGPCLFVFS